MTRHGRVEFITSRPALARVWLGRTTSVIGDRMFSVGTIWLAWSLTHSLGGRLGRIAGPVLAAAIIWASSPRILIAVDAATFLVSALCLTRTKLPARAAPMAHALLESAVENGPISIATRALVRANGLGTAALILWWLALPAAAGHHSHGGTTYALCIGLGSAGGILANLALSRAPERHQPMLLCSSGWAMTAVCIAALATRPAPLVLQALAALCGIALGCTSLGFSFYAANLPAAQRHSLFQLDQTIARTAGALAALAGGAALAYSPTIALIVTGCLLLGVAALIVVTGIETGTEAAILRAGGVQRD